MSVCGSPPERLCIPRVWVTEWQEKLDTPPVPSMSGVEQRRGASAGGIDVGVTNKGGHGGRVPVPGGVLQRSLKYMVHGLGLPALWFVGIRATGWIFKLLDLKKNLL